MKYVICGVLKISRAKYSRSRFNCEYRKIFHTVNLTTSIVILTFQHTTQHVSPNQVTQGIVLLNTSLHNCGIQIVSQATQLHMYLFCVQGTCNVSRRVRYDVRKWVWLCIPRELHHCLPVNIEWCHYHIWSFSSQLVLCDEMSVHALWIQPSCILQWLV